MIIAVDSGVRIANCYSFDTRNTMTVGIVVTGIISDTGLIDILAIESTKPETHDIEIEMARLYAGRADVCIFDGIPARVCRRNVGVIKKMAEVKGEVKGWRCQQHGPYIICADFEADGLIRKAVEMNAAVHRIVHRRAKALFKYELARHKCVLAEGVHVVPELSYFQSK
jgi:hypothetical protein